jgi:hypothetical protein
MADALEDSAARERLLAAVDPDRAVEHHALLRDILRAEMRAWGADDGYYENLYLCGFLLYRVGDVADAPLLWEAKAMDFDSFCGFDFQFVLGGGVERTLADLRSGGHADAAEYLAECLAFDPDLEAWERGRREYYGMAPRRS